MAWAMRSAESGGVRCGVNRRRPGGDLSEGSVEVPCSPRLHCYFGLGAAQTVKFGTSFKIVFIILSPLSENYR